MDSVVPVSVSPPGLHKKISNMGPEKKLMTNLPKRPPVDIEFRNLSYSVPERRSLMRPTRGYKTILKVGRCPFQYIMDISMDEEKAVLKLATRCRLR